MIVADFRENKFVALNIIDCPKDFLFRIFNEYQSISARIQQIKEEIMRLHENGVINIANHAGEVKKSSVTRLSNQIHTLCFGMQKGDIVVIPDAGANKICIGRITDERLTEQTDIIGELTLVRSVEWIKEIRKKILDPCLYKALGAHQAICDISKYAEYIERNYNSYFVVDDKYYYVLTVNAESISAYKLTSIINKLLNTVQKISDHEQLGINVEDIQFSINVNSPGKFCFVTTAKNAVLIMAATVALFGGRINYDSFEVLTDGAFRTLVDCINDFLNQNQVREHRERLFEEYINSLDLQSVENINNMVDAEEMVDDEENSEREE